MKKIINDKKKIYLIEGKELVFNFNRLYIQEKEGKFINKTTKDRYLISDEILLANVRLDLVSEIPEGIQVVLKGQRGKVYSLNQKNEICYDGYYKVLIQISPNKGFNVNKHFKALPKEEEIEVKPEVENITEDQGIQEKINKEFDLEYNEKSKKRKEEIYNSLVNNRKNLLFIGDTFTHMNLKNEFNVINLAVYDIPIIENLLEHKYAEFKIDMLFIESLWEGKDKTWKFFENQSKYEIVEYLIKLTKKRWIKSILYNKEDPIHFKSFLPIAKLVDTVITTDSGSTANYKKYKINAFHLPFFIDESLFNTFEDNPNIEEKIFFAGSYYPKYPERSNFMDTNFKNFGKDFDLFVYDRNKNLKNTPNVYPNNLKKFIKSGGVSVEQIVKETKDYKYAINMNSVIDSETMIARRLFEQLALGKIVVSNYAKSIEKSKLNGVIYDKENNYENIKKSMTSLENDYSARLDRSLRVLRNYSAFSFRTKLYNTVKLSQWDYASYVYVKLNDAKDFFNLLNSLGNQRFRNFILLLDIKKPEIKELIVNSRSPYRIEYYTEDFSTDNYIINYDFSKIYEENFILDMFISMSALREKSLQILGKIGHKTVIYANSSVYGTKVSKKIMLEKVKAYTKKFSNYTIINNMYPSKENIYAHAFVHTRVKEYIRLDKKPYVIILKKQDRPLKYYVFDNVLVIEMNQEGFKIFNKIVSIKSHAIHFVNPYIYDTLEKYATSEKKIVWFHGADCLKAEQKKELYDLNNEYQKKDYDRRKRAMDNQYVMLEKLFKNKKYSSVFVSNWLRDQVRKNVKSIKNSHIIPNSIDSTYFSYNEKNPKGVINVLTIKPFLLEDNTYAIKELLGLLKKVNDSSIHNKVKFTIYGRGNGFKAFEKEVKELTNLNIVMFERYLFKNEIKKAHEKNHILLMPSNQDTHGVSYFEGVSSGLLGISSDNSAKSEYVKSMETGILHKTNDVDDLFEKFVYAVENYDKLNEIRKKGSEYVNKNFESKTITQLELALLD